MKLIGGPIELMWGGYDIDGQGMKLMAGTYEIDGGGSEIDGGGAMKLIGGGR